MLLPEEPSPKVTWIEFWVHRELVISLCPSCKVGKPVLLTEISKQREPPHMTTVAASQNKFIKEVVS